MKRSILPGLALMLLTIVGGCQSSSSQKDATQKPVAVGQVAQDFTLFNQHGKSVTLSQFRNNKNVVLYFYPKDDTPGCTTEACSFRDDLAIFDSLNTVVLGVSVDDTASHRRFAEKYGLKFDLLSDMDKSVSKRYGTLSERGFSKRVTFLIDKEGVIRNIYPKVDVTKHSKEIASYIKERMMK